MELEISEKKNNPFLKRTEVHFVAKHETEKTPNRRLIRSELADALNTKQENIIIDTIISSFGSQISKGYAKVYSSRKHAEDVERKFQLERNKIEGKTKKKDEAESEPAEETANPKEEKEE
ncbi:MAG: 30S ribosomal protein S24e [Candidatus Thermoplasmatota archaeon]|nr:30S ribosomal protein S24e [Candidatus Thermoplasmatota archaeon]